MMTVSLHAHTTTPYNITLCHAQTNTDMFGRHTHTQTHLHAHIHLVTQLDVGQYYTIHYVGAMY